MLLKLDILVWRYRFSILPTSSYAERLSANDEIMICSIDCCYYPQCSPCRSEYSSWCIRTPMYKRMHANMLRWAVSYLSLLPFWYRDCKYYTRAAMTTSPNAASVLGGFVIEICFAILWVLFVSMVVLQMTLTMLISPIVYMVSLQPRHISTHITLKETVSLWSLQLLVSGELY